MTFAKSITGSHLNDGNGTRTYWQHRPACVPAFDPQMFSDSWLAERDYIVNSASAGRGASLFLNIQGSDLVLRHYRRGGMVRNITEQHYLWFGLNRTRAWREFAVLCALEEKTLPAPRPYACVVEHKGIGYSASLITHYLSGNTLAEHVCTANLPNEHWHAIGRCIRQFHAQGVYHADLNAHNILLNEGEVSLIDFDRAVINSNFSRNRDSTYEKNLHRLHRSLGKIVSSGPTFYNEDCWVALKEGYVQA